MLYNEYFNEEESYILEDVTVNKKRINYKTIGFCLIALVLSLISFSEEIAPFPYIMIGLACTFNVPLIFIYGISMIGMAITSMPISSFIIYTIFFAVFTLLTAAVNVEGISRKYINLIKLLLSMTIVKTVATIVLSMSFVPVIYELLISTILFIVLVTSIYVVFNIKKGYVFSSEEMMAGLLLLALLVTPLSHISIYGISLMNIAIVAITMIYGWKTSAALGAVAGLTLGLTATIFSNISLAYVVILAVSGMISAVFRKYGKIPVVISFILGVILVSYLISSSSFYVGMAIEVVAASMILIFLPKKVAMSLDDIFNYNSKLDSLADNLLDVSKEVKAKLNATSLVFKDLADITVPVTKESKLETRDVIFKYIIKHAHDKCIGCKDKKKCIDAEMLKISVDNIATRLERLEEVSSDMLLVTCDKSETLIEEIKQINDSMKITRLLKRKEEENNKLLSKQYDEISKIISNISLDISGQMTEAGIDVKKIREELKVMGYRVYEDELDVDNNGYIEYVFVTDILNDFDKQKKEISLALSSLLEKPMAVKMMLNLTKTEKSKIRLASKLKYKITSSTYKGIKNEEEVSGDSHLVFDDFKSKYISILSDGVGSSLEASSSSKNVISMFEKLLKGGFEEDKAIEMINSIIKIHQAESSYATIDMCIIDLETLHGEFIKLGAAPTYILSEGKISTLTNHNIPVGLLADAEYIPITKRLNKDDIIIQVTDGVVHDESNKSQNSFVNSIKNIDITLSEKQILEYLKKEFVKSRGNSLTDDSTIIVHKISKN